MRSNEKELLSLPPPQEKREQMEGREINKARRNGYLKSSLNSLCVDGEIDLTTQKNGSDQYSTTCDMTDTQCSSNTFGYYTTALRVVESHLGCAFNWIRGLTISRIMSHPMPPGNTREEMRKIMPASSSTMCKIQYHCFCFKTDSISGGMILSLEETYK